MLKFLKSLRIKTVLDTTSRCQRFKLQALQARPVSYVQGQTPQPGIREYFYYIDHQGMLFLDDARMKNFTSCFKDKKFLEFFFKRIRMNNSGRYEDFPYLSLCGRERNFVRCDDYPIVFTHVVKEQNGQDMFCYNHAGDLLKFEFQPQMIFMSSESGRVYHPAPSFVGGVGLVRSKLAIEFSLLFQFRDGEQESPTHFTWENKTYELCSDWFYKATGKKKDLNDSL